MEQFWHFLYFLVGMVCTVFIVKYITQFLIVKYGGKTEEEKEEEKWRNL